MISFHELPDLIQGVAVKVEFVYVGLVGRPIELSASGPRVADFCGLINGIDRSCCSYILTAQIVIRMPAISYKRTARASDRL